MTVLLTVPRTVLKPNEQCSTSDIDVNEFSVQMHNHPDMCENIKAKEQRIRSRSRSKSYCTRSSSLYSFVTKSIYVFEKFQPCTKSTQPCNTNQSLVWKVLLSIASPRPVAFQLYESKWSEVTLEVTLVHA